MKPIKFRGMNSVYAEEQEDYLDLPAYKAYDEYGSVTSCWKLNLWERLKVLITGEIWGTLATFDKPLTPYYLDTKPPDIAIGESK